jgi:hypothetical protein
MNIFCFSTLDGGEWWVYVTIRPLYPIIRASSGGLLTGQKAGLDPTTGLNVVVEETRTLPAHAKSLNSVFVTATFRTRRATTQCLVYSVQLVMNILV